MEAVVLSMHGLMGFIEDCSLFRFQQLAVLENADASLSRIDVRIFGRKQLYSAIISFEAIQAQSTRFFLLSPFEYSRISANNELQ